MDRSWIRTVGWMSILSAVVAIPLALVALFLNAQGSVLKMVVNPTLFTLMFGIYLCIVLTFKRLLTEHFEYQKADSIIATAIAFNVAGFLWNLFGILFPDAFGATFTTAIGLTIAVVTGVVQLALGVNLLPLSPRFPEVRLYAYASIAYGVLLCSILLIPLAIVPGVFAKVVLGLGLLRLAGEEDASLVGEPAHPVPR